MAFRVEISTQTERDAELILEWLITEASGKAGIDGLRSFPAFTLDAP